MLISGLIFVSSAIAKPNFTGTWVREAGSSDLFTAVVGPVIGPKKNLTGNSFILRVNHRGKHLQVATEQNSSKPTATTYDLGRGWHGSIWLDFGGTQYRSKWKGDTLAIEKHVAFHGEFRDMIVYWEQKWVLSPGGDVLTITTATNGVITKEVFSRK